MGPTLARLAKRAAPGKRVVVLRGFSEKGCARSSRPGTSNASKPTCSTAPRSRAAQWRTSCSWPAESSAPRPGRPDLGMNAHVPASSPKRSRRRASSRSRPATSIRSSHPSRGATEALRRRRSARMQFLRRARGYLHYFSRTRARRAGHPPQLRNRHALRRPARRGDACDGREAID